MKHVTNNVEYGKSGLLKLEAQLSIYQRHRSQEAVFREMLVLDGLAFSAYSSVYGATKAPEISTLRDPFDSGNSRIERNIHQLLTDVEEKNPLENGFRNLSSMEIIHDR